LVCLPSITPLSHFLPYSLSPPPFICSFQQHK
jgi:hypothetical protein